MAQIRRSAVDMVKYPMIYRVLAPSQVVVWDFSHQQNWVVSKKRGFKFILQKTKNKHIIQEHVEGS